MELSESVQRGLRSLADPSAFDQSGFQVLVDVSFRSLLTAPSDPGILGEPLSPLPLRRFCLRRLLPVSLYVDISCVDARRGEFNGAAACCQLL